MSEPRDEIARLIRDAVRIRPFGPNSRQIHDNGGTVHLTGTEANEAAEALLPWLAERDRRVAERAWDEGATRVWEPLAYHAYTLGFYLDDNPHRVDEIEATP